MPITSTMSKTGQVHRVHINRRTNQGFKSSCEVVLTGTSTAQGKQAPKQTKKNKEKATTNLVGAGDHAPQHGKVAIYPLPPPPLGLAVALHRHRRFGVQSPSAVEPRRRPHKLTPFLIQHHRGRRPIRSRTEPQTIRKPSKEPRIPIWKRTHSWNNNSSNNAGNKDRSKRKNSNKKKRRKEGKAT